MVQACLRKFGTDTKISNGNTARALPRNLLHMPHDPAADNKKKPKSTVFESWISDEYRARNGGEHGFTVAVDEPDRFTFLSLKFERHHFLKADLVRWTFPEEDTGNVADDEDEGDGKDDGKGTDQSKETVSGNDEAAA